MDCKIEKVLYIKSIICKCDLHIVRFRKTEKFSTVNTFFLEELQYEYHLISVESFSHHVQSRCYTVEVCHNLIVYINLHL